MKINIKASSLVRIASTIEKAIDKKPVIPILSHGVLTTDIGSGEVSMRGTNLEIDIFTKTDCIVIEEGSCTIDTDIVLATLKTYNPDSEVTIESNVENFAVTMTIGKSKYKISGMDPADFPKETDDEEFICEVNGVDFKECISKCIIAAGNDDMRQAMTGVLMDIDANSNSLTMCCTDAFKLVENKITVTYDVDRDDRLSTSMIVPSVIGKAYKYLSENTIEIYVSKNKTTFKDANTSISILNIDSRFPAYKAVIPTTNTHTCTFDRAYLAKVLDRICIFSNKGTHMGIIEFTKEKITISSMDEHFGKSGEEVVEGVTDCKKLKIGVNLVFFSMLLKSISDDTVEIRLKDSGKPFIIKTADVNYTGLLMPMSIMD